MAMQGPDFKSRYVDPAPASNADVGRTIAHLLRLDVSGRGKLIGRVLSETLPNGALPEFASRVVTSEPAVNGLTTVINMQMVGDTRYFDAGGFPAAPSACRPRRCPVLHTECGLHRQEAAAETPALGGDPVEHSKIDVIKPGGQARRCSALLFHHDLRMRDHGGERFDVRIVLVVAKLHRRLRARFANCGNRARFHRNEPLPR